MKLYYSPTSPYVRKVCVLADELGIALERDTVVNLQGLEDSSYGKVNPIHWVPAMALDDGTVLPDSKLICEYLDTMSGHKMVPAEGAERWWVLKLQSVIGRPSIHKKHISSPRYSKRQRGPQAPPSNL